MKHNIFKMSALSAAVVMTLAGCGGSDNDNNSQVAVVTDVAPKASDVAVAGLKQWVPVTAEFNASDNDGDTLSYTFTENGEAVEAQDGVYTFSHGLLTVEGDTFTYVPVSGEDAVIDYTANANGKSASAQLTISDIASDPLANQQWHLRNTGQKSYALSDEMKQGLIDLYVNQLGYSEEEAQTIFDEDFAESEAEELVLQVLA